MAIDIHDPDRRYEPGEARWRARLRCYTRPAMPEANTASRLDAGGNTHIFAFGIFLIAFWCVAAFLILEKGWSF